MVGRGDGRDEVRVSAFDVLVQHNGRFLWTFYGCWFSITGLLSYARIVSAESVPLAWPEVAIIVIVSAAVCVGIAIPLAFGLSEGIPMVIAKMWLNRAREEGRAEGRELGREEGRAEGREQGRTEGRLERDRLWKEWNERRLSAEHEGRPFAEPPPYLNGDPTEDRS